MAYRENSANEAVTLAERTPVLAIRLGDAERQVILHARRDAQAGRAGERLADPRLEGLRLYSMLWRYRVDGKRALLNAGFTPAERRVIDAMLDALPLRTRASRPVTGRLIWALLILLPLLFAVTFYGWAAVYLQDQLIALVVGGLALLVIAPVANAMAMPARRPIG